MKLNKIQRKEAIQNRQSIRNYRPNPINNEDQKKIQDYINNPENQIGPNGNTIKLSLLVNDQPQEKEMIGTYGFIKNGAAFLVGSCENNVESLFDFAYVVENFIIYMSHLEIGTCWLGGTFDREKITQSVNLYENEIIPAIIAIGYPEKKPHFKEFVVRTAIQASKRKSPNQLFFYQSFDQPLENRGEEFQEALELVRLAPSAKNKQPWRLLFSEDLSEVHFYIAMALENEEKFNAQIEYLDIGAAFSHFICGIEEIGTT